MSVEAPDLSEGAGPRVASDPEAGRALVEARLRTALACLAALLPLARRLVRHEAGVVGAAKDRRVRRAEALLAECGVEEEAPPP